MMDDEQLIQLHQRINARVNAGTSTHDDAVDMIATATELGQRGYTLRADGTWIKIEGLNADMRGHIND